MRLAWDGFSLSLWRAPACRCSSQTSASRGREGMTLRSPRTLTPLLHSPAIPFPRSALGWITRFLEHLGVVSAWPAAGTQGLLALSRPGQAGSLAPGHD